MRAVPATCCIRNGDLGDADSGPNDLQNHTVLTAATNTPAGTDIAGTLHSRPNTVADDGTDKQITIVPQPGEPASFYRLSTQ